jgi:IclR family acetate operon transcriptional repressor
VAAAGSATGGAANAAEKVLRTLDALPDHPRLGDLARATDLPKSTVHRILQTMLSEGFVAFDEGSGHYTPGPRLLGLAGRTLSRADTSSGAEPMLRRLQQETGATVHLAVLSGDEAVYVRKVEGNKPYRMISRVGMAVPLHCTGIGKAILAGMTTEEVRAFAGRAGLARRTPATLTEVDDLVAEVARIRERGWATDLEENEIGIVCIGAGVRDHTGAVTAALSVSQLKSDQDGVPLDLLGPLVLQTADQVSLAFGAR